ncbi:hypothetical protein HG537_0G00880 [Torulaspora globosa]|uniref:RING-type domain-containing protein n=1 Tax=Torulaspora globosa TaxID=48254 RepID=A0A7H9HVS6_9SACH|nr:hypothetical protein HG537_0G00880 [Torulaspora sp. CBS 2947]
MSTLGATVLSELLFNKNGQGQKQVLCKVIDSLICSICQEHMYVPMMLECGHNYCYNCLLTWFNSNQDELSCPHCRGNVRNMPCLNSALQQLMETVIEVSSAGEGGKSLECKLKKILDAKKLSDDQYRKDSDENRLFKGVFENTAVGVADEEDDGILRCSNCHWELEDDEDDECPHCSMRIRSRPRPTQVSPSEMEDENPSETDEEEYSSYEEDSSFEEQLMSQERYTSGIWLAELGQASYIYAAKIAEILSGIKHADGMVEKYRNADFSPNSPHTRFPLIFLNFSLADGTVVYFPSYILYMSLTNPKLTPKSARGMSILQRIQDVELSKRQDAIEDLLKHWMEFNFEHMVAEVHFWREVREYGAVSIKYETLIREALEANPTQDYTSPSALSPSGTDYHYPFLVERGTSKGERLLFPSFSIFIKADPDLTENERNQALALASRLEQSVITRGDFSGVAVRTSPQDEEYDSVNDFIASDDDLEAEHSEVSIKERPGIEAESEQDSEQDSDYYEHNEGDGYVSGDSLDDAVHTRPKFIDQDSEQEQDNEDEEESTKIRVPRKRIHAKVKLSDDDSA